MHVVLQKIWVKFKALALVVFQPQKWLGAFQWCMPLGKAKQRKSQVKRDLPLTRREKNLLKWCLHPTDNINNIRDTCKAPKISDGGTPNELKERTQNLMIIGRSCSRLVPLITLLRTKFQQCHIIHRLTTAENIVRIYRKCGRIMQFVAVRNTRWTWSTTTAQFRFRGGFQKNHHLWRWWLWNVCLSISIVVCHCCLDMVRKEINQKAMRSEWQNGGTGNAKMSNKTWRRASRGANIHVTFSNHASTFCSTGNMHTHMRWSWNKTNKGMRFWWCSEDEDYTVESR